ncbi:MAG TPA: dihydrodipicolinate synthase family protein [bacterium]|uniref:Dihydrodipicolinate synthetase family protein n=1 Tax=candidate division TA06 bacterium ADurb.Bin417 TaxID=1852828 RepID=A0A1V5MIN9_UNCT6|nr:MAG: Dihydrodipicolinate synthetase family protein [candidate division TA06 bacterium ADurb.Bin417]HNQ34514.1 dihydrodipicolinate synthase family protein [bacterium]HNS48040.1 dihydrodipicolinate synthase family protein [bacterium]
MKGKTDLKSVRALLLEGQVIPAHPLALTDGLRLDERRQRALTRYYLAAGAGGLAVGVHTTQFEIHDPKTGLLDPVLELAAETAAEADRPLVKVAGICGTTRPAVAEAVRAAELGYQAGLLSLAALQGVSDAGLVRHCRAVAEAIPLFGFYLQPSVGGRVLGYEFWRRFVEIERVVAIKVAPFNRYHTLDVVRAVAESGRTDIALYTGNDDNIVGDLLTGWEFRGRRQGFAGGLLGHWSFWTRRAVELLALIKRRRAAGGPLDDLLTLGAAITDVNAAVFDPAHGFRGCLSGIHLVLQRSGLLKGIRCLNRAERLSPGQRSEIDRVRRAYPDLNDDLFVSENLETWLR